MHFPVIITLVLAVPPQNLAGTVIAVHDGDTITLLASENKQIKVRLNGIDAPEINQAFGTKSKQSLSSKVMGETVDVIWSERDRDGRIIGIVKVGRRNVNREMVNEGYAWMYHKYTSSPTLDKEEAAARSAKLGLWADDDPIAPWDYRSQQEAERKAKAASKKAELVADEQFRRSAITHKRTQEKLAKQEAEREAARRRAEIRRASDDDDDGRPGGRVNDRDRGRRTEPTRVPSGGGGGDAGRRSSGGIKMKPR